MKTKPLFGALTSILGHHSIESLMKQIRSTISSRPQSYDAASGRRLLSALFGGRRDTEMLMRRISATRSGR